MGSLWHWSWRQAEWLKLLTTEHDNMRAGLDFCLRSPMGAGEALPFAADLQQFWWLSGHLSEGRSYLKAALSLPDSQAPSDTRGLALNGAGVMAWMQGDSAEAKTCYEQSLAIRRALNDKAGISAALNNLGNLLRTQGEYAQATRLYEEALALDRETGERAGEAIALLSLGNVALVQGDLEMAHTFYGECLAIEKDIQDQQTLAMCQNNLSVIAIAREDPGTARAYCERSLSIQRSVGNQRGLALALGQLGSILTQLGEFMSGKEAFAECLALCRTLGDKHTTLMTLEAYAIFAHLTGGPQFAVRCLSAVNSERDATGLPRMPHGRDLVERTCTELRNELGMSVFSALWEEGAGQTLDAVLDLASQE
jgi:tetratricopeptide (TPR) repeat protein